MRANSNGISFFLILAEKKASGGNINFSNLSDRDKFLYKMLNFQKTMWFFLGIKSQSTTHHIWELEKIIHNN